MVPTTVCTAKTYEVVEVACYRHLAREPCRFRVRA